MYCVLAYPPAPAAQIETLNKEHGVALRFVEANHPAVESFHQKNTFEMIAAAQRELGQVSIDWLGTGKATPTVAAAMTESGNIHQREMDSCF